MSSDMDASQSLVKLDGKTLTVTKDGIVIKLGQATVIKPDIECSNGVIHGIDTVLMPLPSIVETAINDSNVNVLVEALEAAGLAGPLQGTGPFTLFAPTNAAFTDFLGQLEISPDELLARDDLAEILMYHVVFGSKVMSSEVAGAQDMMTLDGKTVTVTKTGPVMKLGKATVTKPDIESSNGVMHTIDAVLLPPPTIMATASRDG